MVRRCHSLDRERGGRPVAGDARLAELSPQSVWTRELLGLSVRRAASEPCSVRPAQRTPVRGVCCRRPCRRGAPRYRQWACLAGPAGASRAALRQGVEARAGERIEAQEEVSGGASDDAADQLCGCRADAAGRAPGAAAGGDFETDIHHPTDNTLLWDVVRVVTRLIGRLAKALELRRIKGFRDRRRSAHRRMYEIQRMTTRQRQERQITIYRALIGIAEEVVPVAKTALEN